MERKKREVPTVLAVTLTALVVAGAAYLLFSIFFRSTAIA